MKFVTSSTDLLSHLQIVSRVISSKNTLPILDNFLFKLDGNDLEITASDLETTLLTRMTLENTTDSGAIAVPARIRVRCASVRRGRLRRLPSRSPCG